MVPLASTLLAVLITLSSSSSSGLECDLYMADSTIPNAGLGIFSAIELNEGDSVGDGDICIPIFELDWHHDDAFNPFADYVWAGEVMGMKMEVGSPDIEALCPGLDCAINCNLALLNVAKATPVYDDAGLHRSRDPGAGSITPYHNGTTKVTRKIPPGGELFKFYGDSWFETREIFYNLPLTEDYPIAQGLLNKFESLFKSDKSDDSMMKDLYDNVLVSIQSVWDSRTINALPRTFSQAMIALGDDIGMIHQPNATRSLEWLEDNGKCVDHISWGNSTLDGAGHGAFSKRDLPKGTVITGSPLHHIPFKENFMQLYEFFDDQGEWNKGRMIGQQILLNYCFGHLETSMLLCPYGAGVNYINHNKTQANAKVVWSKNGLTGQNNEWFNKRPIEFLQDMGAKLALDYVATRHIKKGEELFLDYGDAWETAWQEHIGTWKPEHSWAEAYLNAHQWNEMFGKTPLRTDEEAVYDPYPTTMQIRCHYDLVEWMEMEWREKTTWEWKLAGDCGWSCSILGRTKKEDGEYVYDIEMWTEQKDRWDHNTIPDEYEFEEVPRAAIRFFDLPYTTDLHLQKAFRHEIGLPDALMKDAWRTVGKQAKTAYNGSRGREYIKQSSTEPAGPKQPGMPPRHDGQEL